MKSSCLVRLARKLKRPSLQTDPKEVKHKQFLATCWYFGLLQCDAKLEP